MPIRKGTPGEGGKPRPEHFSYTPTEAGAPPWFAWCAGEPHWILSHRVDDYTKPCLDWLTEGKLQCPFCRPGKLNPWVGYLGVWRECDLTGRLITLREQNSELSEGLGFGHYVRIYRASGDGNPIAVTRAVQNKPWKSRKLQRQGPCDLTSSLLTIWGLPLLNKWYEENDSDNAVTLPAARTVYVKEDGKPFGPMEQAAAGKAGAQKTSDPVALAQYDELLKRMKANSANGKH